MKHNKAKFILYAMLLASPFAMSAQTAENETSDSEALVNVAYRQVAEGAILGSIAVLDYEKLTEKNYNTYSLDNMQAYVSGFNGNSFWGMDADNDQGYLVLVDGVDMTNEAVIYNSTDDKNLESNEFAPENVGLYVFTAIYNGYNSNDVVIEVKEARVYAPGDLYDEDGVKGVVFYVTEDGTSG